MLRGWHFGTIAAAVSLAMPEPAVAQTFGQLLDSEIPLDAAGAPPQGVRDRQRPELQPEPFRIDDVALSATLDTALGSTSNVLGAQSQRQADGYAEWTPQLLAALAAGPDRAARIVLDYDGKRFFDTPAKSQDGYYFGLSGNAGLGVGGMVVASLFQQRIYEDQLAGSFPANGGGAVAIDQSHAQARLAQTFNRVKLTGALTFDRLSYHATVTTTGALLPQSFRDDSILRASSRLDYTLLANTALFAQVSWRATDYAGNSAYADRTSREWRAIAGASANVTGLIQLSAGIGGYWRQYQAPPTPAFGSDFGPDFGQLAGIAWDLRCVYYASALTTLSLQSKREYADANIALSPGYEASSLHAQLDHELLRNLLLSLAISLESDRFRLIERRDHLRDAVFWADYWISPHLLVKPRIEWLSRTSAGAAAGPQIPEFRTQLALSVRN